MGNNQQGGVNKSMTASSISSSSNADTSQPVPVSSSRKKKSIKLSGNAWESREATLNAHIQNDLKYIQLSLINLDNLVDIAERRLAVEFDILSRQLQTQNDKYKVDLNRIHSRNSNIGTFYNIYKIAGHCDETRRSYEPAEA